MSLEDALKENTATVRELTEILTRGVIPEFLLNRDKPADTAKAAPAPAAEPAKPAAAPKAAKATTAKPAAAKATGDAYAPVKAAILDAIAGGHRKSITDMLAEYDAKTGQDLTPDTYPEVLEKIAVIVGGAADLA